jgi:hypothetical protein
MALSALSRSVGAKKKFGRWFDLVYDDNSAFGDMPIIAPLVSLRRSLARKLRLLTGIKEQRGLPGESGIRLCRGDGHCGRIQRSPDSMVASLVKFLDEVATRNEAKTKSLPIFSFARFQVPGSHCFQQLALAFQAHHVAPPIGLLAYR